MSDPDLASAPPTPAARFSLDDFCARARRLLSLDLPSGAFDAQHRPVRGDHVLDALDPVLAPRPRPAAVLVPVVARPEATVLLTQRTQALKEHAGQIAFPGGKIDASDPSPVAAALREAEEEIGLPRDRVTPLGYLDPYLTGTGFRVLPVVALVRPPFELRLNVAEVDEAFEVPLAFLMHGANHQRHQRELRGRLRQYYAMPYQQRYIWGVTAGILRNLYEQLYS